MDAMLASIPGKLFTEWMAYAEMEPFGEERADLRMAIETAALGNIFYQLFTGKKEAPLEIEDFMPKFEKKEPISKEEAIAAIDAAMMMFVNAGPPVNPPVSEYADIPPNGRKERRQFRGRG